MCCLFFLFSLTYIFIADNISISMYIMCVILCLFSTLSRRADAVCISIIIITATKTWVAYVTLTWHACKYKVHKLHKSEEVPLVEFMYLVFTRMPGESYRRRLRSLLLYLCYVFVCWFCTSALSHVLFQIWRSSQHYYLHSYSHSMMSKSTKSWQIYLAKNLISAWKTSHKDNNKDLSHLQ